jgi:hypothetical protein
MWGPLPTMFFLALNSLAFGESPDQIGYSASGSYKWTAFNRSGQPTAEQDWLFNVSVYGDAWYIQAKLTEAMSVSMEAYCDGVNVVTFMRNLARREDLSTAVTLSRPHYPSQGYTTMIPWFAFASGRFLGSRAYLPAVWEKAYNVEALVYESKVSRSRFPPYLPVEAEFNIDHAKLQSIATNDLLSIEAKYADEQQFVKYMKKVYEDGFTRARYKALSFTNLNGALTEAKLPKNFKLVVYNKITPDSEAHISAECEGVLEHCEFISTSFDVPEPCPPMLFFDHRFRDARHGVDVIRYKQDDFAIRAIDDAELEQQFADKIRMVSERKNVSPRGRPIVRLLILAILVVPVLLLVLRRPRK